MTRAQDRRSATKCAPLGVDRSADDPALPELPLQRHARPVRRGPVLERGHVLHAGLKGRLRGDQARRRSRAQGRDVSRFSSSSTAGSSARGSGAECAQRGAARRFHERFDRGRRALEQGHPEGGVTSDSPCRTRRSTARSARCPACRSPPRPGESARRSGTPRLDWLPTADDRAFVRRSWAASSSRAVRNWIAPPVGRINRQPLDCEYVRLQ